MDVLTLMELNFRTRNPDELLWYLREYMGCVKATFDELSWKVASESQGGRGVWRGGIVWVPGHRKPGHVPMQDFHFVHKMNKASA
jgi:hypothetical protein